MTRPAKRLTDWVWLSFVVLAGVKYTFHLDAIEDIPVFSAEAAYVQRGMHLSRMGVVDPADSPLYSVWYYVLSLFTSDPLRLYNVNHAFLIVSTTALLYLLLRALNTSPILAALGSMVYLVSNALFAPPFNGLFALFIMLVFLNWAMRCASEENAYTVAAAGALLMAFTRAEYLAALVLFLVWLAIHDLWSGRPQRRTGRVARIGGILLLTAVAVALIGNPLGTSKSSLAFCVSYFEHEVVSGGLQVNGTTGLQFPFDCSVVTQATFGAAQSIPALFMSNPAAYAGFVLHNMGTYVMASSIIPFVTPFVFLSPSAQTLLAYIELALLVGALLLIVNAVTAGAWPVLKASLPRRFPISAGIFFAANVLAAVIYFPRWYYLLPQTALLICCLFAALSSILKAPAVHTRSLRAALAGGLLLVVVVPSHVYGWLPPIGTADWRPGGTWSAAHATGRDSAADERILGRRFELAVPTWSTLPQYWSASDFSLGANPLEELRPRQILANRVTLESIRALPIASRVNILGAGNYAAFLPDNYRYPGWWTPRGLWTRRQQSFLTFLTDQKVDMIVSNYLMEAYYGHVPEFRALMQNPEAYGFVRRDIPGSAESLLIKPSLFQDRAAAAGDGRAQSH